MLVVTAANDMKATLDLVAAVLEKSTPGPQLRLAFCSQLTPAFGSGHSGFVFTAVLVGSAVTNAEVAAAHAKWAAAGFSAAAYESAYESRQGA